MTIALNHFLAAKIKFHYTMVAQITPYKILGDKVHFYWYTGPSRASAILVNHSEPENGQMCILYDYGRIKEDRSFNWWNKADLHFLRNYYPAKAIAPIPDRNENFYGWIAPNGDYYMALYGHHDETARSIWATLHNEVLPGYDAREKLLKTWIQLNHTFVIGAESITIEQIATINKINEKFGTNFEYDYYEVAL